MAELPLSRRHALAGAAALAIVLLLAGRLFVRSGTTVAAEPIRPAAHAAPARAAPREVVVDVVGAVLRPGLYRLHEGDRVADALARAGGWTGKAQLGLVNLAAPLADGEQVVVPARGAAVAGAAPPAGVAASGGAPAGPVQLSSATAEQLDALPGVGPVTAQKIIDYRTKHGPFHSVDELDAIPGIGPARLDQLRDLVVP